MQRRPCVGDPEKLADGIASISAPSGNVGPAGEKDTFRVHKALIAASLFLLPISGCTPDPVPDGNAAATQRFDSEPVAIVVPAGEYVSDPNHASIGFKLQHLGLSFYAMQFRTFDATVKFDPHDLAASGVTAVIRASDIIAGYAGDYTASHPRSAFTSWQEELANSANFLDATRFPTISFTSTSVTPSGRDSARVTGNLTLRGVTKPVTLDVKFSGQTAAHPFNGAPAIGLSATGVFKRSDFGLDYLLPAIVGDEVKVDIEGDFLRTSAS